MTVTRYGFEWGPMLVERIGHIPGRGYALHIRTPYGSMQIGVSDKGMNVTAHEWQRGIYPIKRDEVAS